MTPNVVGGYYDAVLQTRQIQMSIVVMSHTIFFKFDNRWYAHPIVDDDPCQQNTLKYMLTKSKHLPQVLWNIVADYSRVHCTCIWCTLENAVHFWLTNNSSVTMNTDITWSDCETEIQRVHSYFPLPCKVIVVGNYVIKHVDTDIRVYFASGYQTAYENKYIVKKNRKGYPRLKDFQGTGGLCDRIRAAISFEHERQLGLANARGADLSQKAETNDVEDQDAEKKSSA